MSAPLRRVVFQQFVQRNASSFHYTSVSLPMHVCRRCSHILQSCPNISISVIAKTLVSSRHYYEERLFQSFQHSLKRSPHPAKLSLWGRPVSHEQNLINTNIGYAHYFSMSKEGRCVSTYISRQHHVNRLARSLQLRDPYTIPGHRTISDESDKRVHATPLISQKENIYTVPNLLTLLRMVSSPFLGYMVMQEQFHWALALFAFAGFTDLLDGFIARNFKNQNSILGSAMDPMADKILVCVLTFTLTAIGLIPLPLTVLIVGRDIGLVAAAFYLRYITLPQPKTLARYFDVTLVSAKMEPFLISKWNTAFQLSLVALTLAAPVFDFVEHPFLQGLWYLTGATTFISGLQYVFYWKDSVKIVKPITKT